MASKYRLRDFVNRIHHGSLNNPMLNSNKGKISTLIFATVNGAIIVDVSLHYKQYHMLEKLQYVGMVYTFIMLRSSGLLATTLASLPFRENIEEPNRLEMAGKYPLRDFVNKIHHGSLNNPILNSDKGKNPTLTFGTVNGAIIVLLLVFPYIISNTIC